MIQHEIIAPFSYEWWIFNLVTLGIILGILYTGKVISNEKKTQLTMILAGLFIFEFFSMEFYNFFTGVWSIRDSLPLHLCSLMWFVSIYFFITKSQTAFEMMLFIGMPGGVHSLLTPELTHGNGLVHKIDFFIGHGGLVLVPFYAIMVLRMWPRQHAWWKSFVKLQCLVFIVAICNYILKSNYMYLASPPIADNPLIPSNELIFGQWPYYVLIFELIVLTHAALINLPFWYNSKRRN
tara:strand:+ start:461 stop:1171 length:711 start_codon:yes stop_codon:yes gene_type:complete